MKNTLHDGYAQYIPSEVTMFQDKSKSAANEMAMPQCVSSEQG